MKEFKFKREISILWYAISLLVGLLLLSSLYLLRLDWRYSIEGQIIIVTATSLFCLSSILNYLALGNFNYNIYVHDTYIIIKEKGKDEQKLNFPFTIIKKWRFLQLTDGKSDVTLRYNGELKQFLKTLQALK